MLTTVTDGKQARPSLTVGPLAQSLAPGVQVNEEIDSDDAQGVADAVQSYQGNGNILICWEHGNLTKIAQAIGVQDAPEYPDNRYVSFRCWSTIFWGLISDLRCVDSI